MSLLTTHAAARRYAGFYAISMATFGVAMGGGGLAISYLHPTGLALAALGLTGAMASLGLSVRADPDEFQRALKAEAMLWATGLVLSLFTAIGFLAIRGAIGSAFWLGMLLALVFPLWITAFWIATLLVGRRYR
jgi:hypothetical protein